MPLDDGRTMSISQPFPRMPLVGAAVLVAFALCIASYGRYAGLGLPAKPGIANAVRDLRFDDRADGAVIVSLAPTGQVLDVMTGQNGFLRGTLRGFARIRRAGGIGSAPPLHLAGYPERPADPERPQHRPPGRAGGVRLGERGGVRAPADHGAAHPDRRASDG